jgi:hypothetical protein
LSDVMTPVSAGPSSLRWRASLRRTIQVARRPESRETSHAAANTPTTHAAVCHVGVGNADRKLVPVPMSTVCPRLPSDASVGYGVLVSEKVAVRTGVECRLAITLYDPAVPFAFTATRT